MLNFLIPNQAWQVKGIAMIRILTGFLLIYHGKEIFDATIMQGYFGWDIFKSLTGKVLVYAGKSAELISGISLLLGLFTRAGGLLCAGTLGYITFLVGNGRFWYEDQHPFLFVLLGLIFFFYGAGTWGLDTLFSNQKKNP